MPTDNPPSSLAGAQEPQLLSYLDSVIQQGERFLYGTSLEWATAAMRSLFSHPDSPARRHYAIAPASSSFARHHCFAGGLMYHSVEVFYLSAKMWESISHTRLTRERRAALWVASILHDMNKCCDPLGRPYYTANILNSGKISDKKPWKSNDDFLVLNPGSVASAFGSGVTPGVAKTMEIGVKILNSERGRIADGKFSYLLTCGFVPEFAQLPPDIVQAIFYHDGGYGQGRYELNGNEDLLTIIIHAADMASSRFECSWIIDPISTLHELVPVMDEQPYPPGGAENPQGPLPGE